MANWSVSKKIKTNLCSDGFIDEAGVGFPDPTLESTASVRGNS